MDANGTRFHLMLGRDDFAAAMSDSNLEWNNERHELTLSRLAFSFPSSPYNRKPTLDDRRGAAADRYGNVYFIADSRNAIMVQNSGSRTVDTFWNASNVDKTVSSYGSFQPIATRATARSLPLSGLAVTREHFLVAGTPMREGLLVFDLHHGGSPRFVAGPSRLDPWDIAPAPDGGIWILDHAHRNLWSVDRNFDFLSLNPGADVPDSRQSDFHPLAGPAPLPSTLPTRPSPLGFGSEVISVDVLPDGTVLVLETDSDQQDSRIFVVRKGAPNFDVLSLFPIRDLIEESARAAFHLHAQDMAVEVTTKPDCTWTARLFVVAASGDQAFSFDIRRDAGKISLEPIPKYFPMRLYNGRAIFGSGPRVYYDSRGEWEALKGQKIFRYAERATISRTFDSGLPDCTWHRLMIDGSIPGGATVVVQSRSANTIPEIEYEPVENWPKEPLYRRGDGSEIPYQGRDRETWEQLIQNARGRYLKVAITLQGDGRITPLIRALRVYYPRFSYLEKYLPRVYREDENSAHFLDRFLANFEGMFTTIEDRIATVQFRFDPDTAPVEDLEYLASWIGVTLDAAWDEYKQRLFLRNASRFIQCRGTRRGLLIALRLALEPAPDQQVFDDPDTDGAGGIRIVEHFALKRTPGIEPALDDIQTPLTLRSRRWTPSQGAAELNRLYSSALQRADNAVAYPLSPPVDPNEFVEWQRFSIGTFGFIPSNAPTDLQVWQSFLERRYKQISSLNEAWRGRFTTFSEVPAIANLPSNVRTLTDWFDFQSVVLSSRSAAHQFTVYLPVTDYQATSETVNESRRDLAQRIVALQKPAHTTFHVDFYWTFFRLGSMRLGIDTVLDVGSRSPNLLKPAVLGESFVESSYLAPNYPFNLSHRTVLGRGGCHPEPNRKEEA